MRLDVAHRKFEALDVQDFEDVDVVGEEDTIFLDSNWVVVQQEPAAGTKGVDTGTTIKLEVGNEADSEVLEMIPADSPFAVEMAREKEADEPDDPEPTGEAEPSTASARPDPYADFRDDEGFVSRDDFGKDWPLKVEAGFVSCPESFGEGAGSVIFTTLGGDEYGLNGQAAHDWPSIRPIWADDPTYGKNGGVKKSTVPLIEAGLALC